jgi:hypothetical protein
MSKTLTAIKTHPQKVEKMILMAVLNGFSTHYMTMNERFSATSQTTTLFDLLSRKEIDSVTTITRHSGY